MSKASKIWQGVRFAAIGSVSKGLSLLDRDWGKRYLVREISRIPGLPAKVAQLLEMKHGISQRDGLTGVSLPLEWIKETIQREAPDLAAEIAEISEEGLTASLGQVHWVKLKSGQELAVKVQYPGIKEQIEAQLEILLAGLELVPMGRRFGVDIGAYREFLGEFFLQETDYLKEAQAQLRFRNLLQPQGGILVPEVIEKFSSRGILVQSFESARWIDSLVSLPENNRGRVAEALARLILVGGLKMGLVHTDLHSRNWGYNEEKESLVLYDYGATLTLDTDLTAALRHFFYSPDDSPEGCLTRFGDLGFDIAKLSHIAHQLPEVIEILAEPFRHGKTWRASEWHLGQRIEAVLGSEKWWLRVAGPPWFLLLMRGWLGALTAMQRLGVAVDLENILVSEIGAVPQEPSKAGAFGSREQAGQAPSQRCLRVLVKEGNTAVVDLELPLSAVESLEDLVPEGVRERLVELKINLLSIKQKAIASGLEPQELFRANLEKRFYRVWIQ